MEKETIIKLVRQVLKESLKLKGKNLIPNDSEETSQSESSHLIDESTEKTFIGQKP